MAIIFWDFLILYEIFFSPQLKQSVFISNKHGIYKLPHGSKNLPKNRNWTFPIVHYFAWKLVLVSNILYMII